MSSRDLAFIEDVRVYARHAINLVGQRTADEFAEDLAVRLAVLHCLSVIGEAANTLSKSATDAMPDVPWSKIIGLRHLIIHHYQRIDVNEIWRIVVRDLAPFLKEIDDYLGAHP